MKKVSEQNRLHNVKKAMKGDGTWTTPKISRKSEKHLKPGQINK